MNGEGFLRMERTGQNLPKSIGKIVEFTLGKYGKRAGKSCPCRKLLEKGKTVMKIANLTGRE